jgi:acyl carrier protein
MNRVDRVIRFISEELLNHLHDRSLTEDDDLLTTGRVNSLGIMRLVAFLEVEFGLTISPEDVTIENFRSVRLIVGYLNQQQAALQDIAPSQGAMGL